MVGGVELHSLATLGLGGKRSNRPLVPLHDSLEAAFEVVDVVFRSIILSECDGVGSAQQNQWPPS